ncbi:hypothetical protein ACFLX9_03415 [Chloroflexota bacterium]
MQSGIRFLGKEPVFLAGVERGLKRGISAWITQGWLSPSAMALAFAEMYNHQPDFSTRAER